MEHIEQRRIRVILDCGTDESPIDPRELQFQGNAVRIRTPWHFPIGTCLSMKLCGDQGDSTTVEAMVADCCRIQSPHQRYATTLLLIRDCCDSNSPSLERAVRKDFSI